jgi:Polyketide cyclase / dehydrase and lipid transport
MASICKTINIDLAAAAVWDAVRDVGNLHLRLAPRLVADCQLNDGGTERLVTFADGSVLAETIVAVDDATMRFVWAARNPSLAHHNAAMQVTVRGADSASVSWTADVLPHPAADFMAPFIEKGLATMKAHLESGVP